MLIDVPFRKLDNTAMNRTSLGGVDVCGEIVFGDTVRHCSNIASLTWPKVVLGLVPS